MVCWLIPEDLLAQKGWWGGGGGALNSAIVSEEYLFKWLKLGFIILLIPTQIHIN
jgi:hypothetical protein